MTQFPEDAQMFWSTVTFIADSSLVWRHGRQPQAHDRVNDAGRRGPPGWTGQRCAPGERAFEVRARGDKEVGAHVFSLETDAGRQFRQAMVDAVDALNQRRRAESVLDD